MRGAGAEGTAPGLRAWPGGSEGAEMSAFASVSSRHGCTLLGCVPTGVSLLPHIGVVSDVSLLITSSHFKPFPQNTLC